MQQEAPKRYWLLTYPRTASNLLMRMLNVPNQPSLFQGSKNEYFFLPTMVWRFGKPQLANRAMNEWSPEERDGYRQSHQDSFDGLRSHVQAAKAAGKDVFIKEHVPWLSDPVAENKFTFGDESLSEDSWMVQGIGGLRSQHNATILPDEFLETWRRTFLIRHPALAFPSLHRSSLGDDKPAHRRDHQLLEVEMTLHWSRRLYDWYVTTGGSSTSVASCDSQISWPLVLDADDLMTNRNLVTLFARSIGLDESKIQFEWESATEEQLESMQPIERRMLRSINASTAVLRGKTADGLDIATEASKWNTEFGPEVGMRLEKLVRAAMPDYEYLRAKRLCADVPTKS